MKKIAIIGTIHEDGCTFLKKQKFDIFEITNLTTKNLILAYLTFSINSILILTTWTTIHGLFFIFTL